MGLMAAGVAFYAFLSIVPALIAATLVFGLVTDPAQVQQYVSSSGQLLPPSARGLVTEQMTSLASTDRQGLGIGLIVSLSLALWSASGGMGNLITAVNTAYGRDETRGFLRRKATALVLTIGALIVFASSAALVAAFPAVVRGFGIGGGARVGLEVLRWLVVLVVVAIGLAVLYRFAPDRAAATVNWVSVGATAAMLLWVVISVAFSIYVENFSSYGATYGSLAGVVVLLMWLWLSIYAVLLGAEVNAQHERQVAGADDLHARTGG